MIFLFVIDDKKKFFWGKGWKFLKEYVDLETN